LNLVSLSYINHLDENMNAINLPILREQELNIILQYCQHHNYNFPEPLVKPLRSNELINCVNDPWDANLLNSLDLDQTTDLLNAVTYIGCSGLADICYAKLALYFRSKFEIKFFVFIQFLFKIQ
jgi:hypothetical protein